MNSVAAIAGSISTALFIASTLPMLWKAARTAVTSGEARGAGQLDPQRLYLVWSGSMRSGPPAAETGDTMLMGNNLLHRNRNIRLI
ncbi:MAG TPA: hypothetical protein VN609_10425 [Propionibacteriaceae bacterium]|nr:hypothetical protein [Propionibacteriaceae bacterium]